MTVEDFSSPEIKKNTDQLCNKLPLAVRLVSRPLTADIEKVKQLREQGLSLSAIARECGISKTRVHQIPAA